MKNIIKNETILQALSLTSTNDLKDVLSKFNEKHKPVSVEIINHQIFLVRTMVINSPEYLFSGLPSDIKLHGNKILRFINKFNEKAEAFQKERDHFTEWFNQEHGIVINPAIEQINLDIDYICESVKGRFLINIDNIVDLAWLKLSFFKTNNIVIGNWEIEFLHKGINLKDWEIEDIKTLKEKSYEK